MDQKRKIKSKLMIGVLLTAAFVAAIPFALISIYVLYRGFTSINLEFFTGLPAGPGESGGGIGNAILGSAIMVGLATLIAVPWGIFAGLYLSEYSHTRLAKSVSFAVDLLSSVPSIVVGIFIYTVVVVTLGNFSALAGACALFVIMIPIIIRSTEEILKLVPLHIRESGLALGLPRWRVLLQIVLPGIKNSLISGIMLSIARVSGETAPLLFTSLANQYWSFDLMEPMASIPVQVYNFAISGFENLERQAWAGCLVLILFVVVTNILTRFLFSTKRVV